MDKNQVIGLMLISVIIFSIGSAYGVTYDYVRITSSGDHDNVPTTTDTASSIHYTFMTENYSVSITEVDFMIYSTDTVTWNIGLSDFNINGYNMKLSDTIMYMGSNYTEFEYKYKTPQVLSKSDRPEAYEINLFTNLMPNEKLPVQIQVHYTDYKGIDNIAGSTMNHINAISESDANSLEQEVLQQQVKLGLEKEKMQNKTDEILNEGTEVLMIIFGTAGILAIIGAVLFIKKTRKMK